MTDGSISIRISLRVGETSVSSVFIWSFCLLLGSAVSCWCCRVFWLLFCVRAGASLCVVRKGGLEPPHLSVPDPKSGASANSATFAFQSLTRFNLECFFQSSASLYVGTEKLYHSILITYNPAAQNCLR